MRSSLVYTLISKFIIEIVGIFCHSSLLLSYARSEDLSNPFNIISCYRSILNISALIIEIILDSGFVFHWPSHIVYFTYLSSNTANFQLTSSEALFAMNRLLALLYWRRFSDLFSGTSTKIFLLINFFIIVSLTYVPVIIKKCYKIPNIMILIADLSNQEVCVTVDSLFVKLWGFPTIAFSVLANLMTSGYLIFYYINIRKQRFVYDKQMKHNVQMFLTCFFQSLMWLIIFYMKYQCPGEFEMQSIVLMSRHLIEGLLFCWLNWKNVRKVLLGNRNRNGNVVTISTHPANVTTANVNNKII